MARGDQTQVDTLISDLTLSHPGPPFLSPLAGGEREGAGGEKVYSEESWHEFRS